MAAGTKRTTSHEEIRRRIEARGAGPPGSNGTGRGDDPGILRLDFPGRGGDESLEEIDWDDEANDLAFLDQETTADGGESRLSKLVGRTGD
ncbi:MAG TPA: hypothetical protein VFR63_10350 [Gaiellaceae bacterium]|nr:hypothetical protein [Gaiellaceae bacterium]